MSANSEPEGGTPVGLDERVRVEVSVRVGRHPTATVLEIGRVYELEMGWSRATGVLEGVKCDVRDSADIVWLSIYDPVVGTCGYKMETVHALAALAVDAEAWCDARMAPYYNQAARHG